MKDYQINSARRRTRPWVYLLLAIVLCLGTPLAALAEGGPSWGESREGLVPAPAAPLPVGEPQPQRCPPSVSVEPIVEVEIYASSDDELETLQDLGLACEGLGTCRLEIPHEQLTDLKSSGLRYNVLAQAIKVTGDGDKGEPPPPQPSALAAEYGINETDYYVPDYDWENGQAGWNYSYVCVDQAPYTATVTRIVYGFRIQHTWPSDLRVVLTNDVVSATVWDRAGGSDDGDQDDDPERDDDIFIFRRSVEDAFDGQDVNGWWYLDVYDCAGGDTGFIDDFEIWIYYDDGNPYPYPEPQPDIAFRPSSLTFTAGSDSSPAPAILSQGETEAISSHQVDDGISACLPDASAYQIVDSETGQLVQVDGFGMSGEPGAPQLPVKRLRFLLPPNIDWSSFEAALSAGDWAEVPGATATTACEFGASTPAGRTTRGRTAVSFGLARPERTRTRTC